MPPVALLCHPWQQAAYAIRGNGHPWPSMESQSCQLGNKHATPTRHDSLCHLWQQTPPGHLWEQPSYAILGTAFKYDHPMPSEAATTPFVTHACRPSQQSRPAAATGSCATLGSTRYLPGQPPALPSSRPVPSAAVLHHQRRQAVHATVSKGTLCHRAQP